jgi:hypothetical protein
MLYQATKKPKVTVKMAAVQEFLMGHHHHASDDDDSISVRAASDRSTSSDVQRFAQHIAAQSHFARAATRRNLRKSYHRNLLGLRRIR